MCLVPLVHIAHVNNMIGSTKRIPSLKDMTRNEIISIEMNIGAQGSVMYYMSVSLQ